MTKFPQYYSELPVEDQQQIERATKMLSGFINIAQVGIKSYRSGDSVLKLMQDLRYASLASAGMLDELIQRHGIPDAEALRSITEDERLEWREMLTQQR